MAEVEYRKLELIKLPLVNKFYKLHRSGMRAKGDETVWIAQQEHGEPLAAVKLRQVETGYWLTGLFTRPDCRHRGIATGLVARIAGDLTVPIWLFCHPDLVPFYRRIGFEPCSALPEALASRLARYQQSQLLLALERPGRCDRLQGPLNPSGE